MLQKNSQSLLQGSCEGKILLEVAADSVKSLIMVKISLLWLVLASMRSARTVCLVFRICSCKCFWADLWMSLFAMSQLVLHLHSSCLQWLFVSLSSSVYQLACGQTLAVDLRLREAGVSALALIQMLMLLMAFSKSLVCSRWCSERVEAHSSSEMLFQLRRVVLVEVGL